MSKSKISSAREGYKPRTATVTVCLDSEIADQRDDLMRALAEANKTKAKANDRLTQKTAATKLREEIAELEDREREHMHTLRFTKLDGLAWADLTAIYAPRENSAFDQQLGYNHHAAAIHAAKVNGVELVDGETRSIDDDDWSTILEVASGWDVENIVTAVLELNVFHASRAVGRLKKD
jgi:hypothetical protein